MPIKITSKYTPLTYDEITKPLIQATEAQMAVENAYVEAQDRASAAMAQANQETDPIAYSKLKSYAEDLQAQADSLMRYGLQRSSRQSLLNMRRRYGEEITPIAAAIERRNALSEEQRKLQASNPYLRHERDMRTVSLDAMLNNPNMDYGRSIDLSDVQKRAATLVKAMGQGRTDVKYGKQLDRYTKEVLMREGFTPEEIQAALSNDDTANRALSVALDNLYSSTGADSFRAGVDSEVWDAIQQGAMMGAGEVKATIHADEEAKRRDALADRAHNEAFQRELYGIRYGEGAGTASETWGGITAHPIGYNVEKDGKKTKIYEDADGNRYTLDVSANGKTKVYTPTDLTPTENVRPHTQTDINKNRTWVATHGGDIAGFDKDDDYGTRSKAKFDKILSKPAYINADGSFTSLVGEYSVDEAAAHLDPKEWEKAAAAIAESGLYDDEIVIIKVQRGGGIDDDVFVVRKDVLPEYKQDLVNRTDPKERERQDKIKEAVRKSGQWTPDQGLEEIESPASGGTQRSFFRDAIQGTALAGE